MQNFPKDIPFHLFSSCMLVKGYKRSCIYDTQRGDFEYIPNSLLKILKKYKNYTYNELEFLFDNIEDKDVLNEYFEMLYDKEYIFFSKLENNFFPNYSKNFIRPYNISTLVIDVNDFNEKYLNIIIKNIFESKVECLVIRAIDISSEDMRKVLSKFNDISTRIIQLLISKKSELRKNDVEDLFIINNRLSLIIKVDNVESEDISKRGIFLRTKVDIINAFEKVVNVSDFMPNIDLYLESLTYHTFYNRRVYVNFSGDVFRFERDKKVFGNIKNNRLLEIIKVDDFDYFWRINKDNIIICKDCEYRYMCNDNTLPLHKDDNDKWALGGICNYDPYLAKWADVP